MRLPRLPVSRRRHDELAELVCAYNRIASEDLAEYKRRARKAEARVAELKQAIRTFVTSEDTHEPGPFVKDGNWHLGPCVEGGPRMEDVYPHGFQVCADEECFAYWPCDVERLRRVLDGHDRQEADPLPGCQTCNDTGTFELDGHEYWCKACRGIPDPPPAEPVTYQDGRRYRLVQDGERSFRAVPAPPPAEPDPELIGHMEQPNPGPRRRRLGPDWQHLQGGWP